MKVPRCFSLSILTLSVVLTISVQLATAAEGLFGLGVVTGEPTGIAMKYWIGENTAISGAAAWSFVKDTSFHIHADWLRHNRTFLTREMDIESGYAPIFYGVGGRMAFDDDPRIGIRFVVGTGYVFEDAPFDIFIELAPIMDLAPKTELSGNAAIGVRYWFE